MQQGRDGGPSAQRIAEILRSTQDPWPREAPANAVDLAQRVVSQSRRMLDAGSGPGASQLSCQASQLGAAPTAAALASGGDPKVSQLAERVSVLVAGQLQQRCDIEKQDVEKQLQQVGAQMDERVRILEARVTACEHRAKLQERSGPDPQAAASAALALREARALVGNSISEVEAQWRAHQTELRSEQQQQLRQLEELADEVRHLAGRVGQAESVTGGFERAIRRSEEHLQGLLARDSQHPPWFAQLEGAIAALERRLNEQQVATEVQLGRIRVDTDGLLRRSEGLQNLRNDLLRETEERLQQEMDRLDAAHRFNHSQVHGQAAPEVAQWGGAARDLSRRIDESEARVAALKVRVDAHDSRFGSISERAEALCQQAVEGTRQATLRLREEILNESDCQVGILRQRVETLSDLCEELMMPQAPCGRDERAVRGGTLLRVGERN